MSCFVLPDAYEYCPNKNLYKMGLLPNERVKMTGSVIPDTANAGAFPGHPTTELSELRPLLKTMQPTQQRPGFHYPRYPRYPL